MEQYRKSPRAKWIEYNEGIYFITICTLHKKHYFGEIANAEMRLSSIGEFVYNELENVTQRHEHISIPQFVVMPNHIHAVVVIDTPTHQRCVPTCDERVERCITSKQRPLLSAYVGMLKSVVTKYARKIGVPFAWQSRYHDHAIRGIYDGNRISEYIDNNILRWDMDCFNDENSAPK